MHAEGTNATAEAADTVPEEVRRIPIHEFALQGYLVLISPGMQPPQKRHAVDSCACHLRVYAFHLVVASLRLSFL